MISSNITGTAAYAAVQNAFAPGSDITVAAEPSGGTSGTSSFGAALQGAITGLTNAGHAADAASASAMMGKGDMTDVVMAVSKAEMALQTSVAVRDRVISAYQDIMRMAV
jgi:flagellar hook-basal body complex protein FliE